MSKSLAAADLNDDVLAAVTDWPGLTAAKLAKRLKADAGAVRRTLTYLVQAHYVALTREGGRDVFGPAER